MQEIRIGPAGLGGDEEAGLNKLKEAGLNFCEVAFTYNVYMKKDEAEKAGKLAKEFNIKLSCHAPYYINLNSEDKEKIEASKKRILKSAERADQFNGESVVFHPGYYGKFGKEESYENIKNAILEMQEVIKKNKWKVKLAPETTGKKNVFGNLDEILRLVKGTKCFFCVDFAHLLARNNGKINYEEIFEKLKEFKKLHCHFSGISYTSKGERNHLVTEEKDIKELAKHVLESKKDITIVNESPNCFEDAVKTKKIFEELGYRF